MDRDHRELHQFIGNRVGDAYRTAFYYDHDEWEALYVRDDLATDHLRKQVPGIIERARKTQALLREEDYPTLGETQATTEMHETGVILHVPEGNGRGVLVSLEKSAVPQLESIITRAIGILQPSRTTESNVTTADY